MMTECVAPLGMSGTANIVAVTLCPSPAQILVPINIPGSQSHYAVADEPMSRAYLANSIALSQIEPVGASSSAIIDRRSAL